MDKTDHLKSDIAELIPALIVMRRNLHAHPELAFEEGYRLAQVPRAQ